jgi:hypothetical protein
MSSGDGSSGGGLILGGFGGGELCVSLSARSGVVAAEK